MQIDFRLFFPGRGRLFIFHFISSFAREGKKRGTDMDLLMNMIRPVLHYFISLHCYRPPPDGNKAGRSLSVTKSCGDVRTPDTVLQAKKCNRCVESISARNPPNHPTQHERKKARRSTHPRKTSNTPHPHHHQTLFQPHSPPSPPRLRYPPPRPSTPLSHYRRGLATLPELLPPTPSAPTRRPCDTPSHSAYVPSSTAHGRVSPARSPPRFLAPISFRALSAPALHPHARHRDPRASRRRHRAESWWWWWWWCWSGCGEGHSSMRRRRVSMARCRHC